MLVKTTATGSKGNNYALVSGGEILLLECGVPAKEMLKTIDYQTSKVVGCLLSHEHGDHAKYIKQYMQYGVKVYGSDEVQSNIELIYGENIEGIKRMNRKKLGSFSVIPFRVPHGETECDGWLIDSPEGKLLFITDAEYCPYDFSKMHINYGLIECNYSMDNISFEHDEVKNRRVVQTHMEVQTCKRLIQSINSESLRSIGLIHLSAENGNPVRFTEEIQEIVDCDVDVWVAEKGAEKEFRLMPF
jgi:phosphoribosyl 1,2-cyclic phosphodiesterase